ncbi:MAG: beta-galactosidase [Candidatus Lokiarchaeota archaeon]|nr:beta-galactosidase [Candidatus Lokiarchaeota archaeon]
MQEEIRSNGIIIRKNRFQIGSRIVFINSGEIHYFRIPSDEWEDRLTKAKTLGLNTISTSIFWSYHEEEAGKFDITSPSKDLDHFLHLCENKGFYLIVRVGPWINSDLQYGGIPSWVIKDHPKILCQNEDKKSLRKPYKNISYLSPTFLRLVDSYMDKIAGVLRRHLYPHGGLILLQLDHEINISKNQSIFEGDYNPVALEFYKTFLKEKYRDIDTVNSTYSQNFLSFDHVEPPTSRTQEDGINSQNEFRILGEFMRNLDWMEFKEKINEEYISSLSYILRKKGLYLPYMVNVPYLSSPVNANSYYKAYKTKIAVGLDVHDDFLKQIEENQYLLEANIELIKTQIPLLCLIPELKIGIPDEIISPNSVHLLTRLVLGNGVKGINYYMGVGGRSPKTELSGDTYSILKKSVNFNGESLIVELIGDFYDYNAPIGIQGQKNPSFDVIESNSDYIQVRGEKLLGAEKVYDGDIAVLYYHPYSRLNFNTSKFGFIPDPQQILQESPFPEYEIFLRLGYHPKWIDLQTSSIEDLKKHKIVVAIFFSFLDKTSMNLLKHYAEEGGIILSFYDIPTRNGHMRSDDTLSSLYHASIQKKENPKSIRLEKTNFNSYRNIYSYHLEDTEKNQSKGTKNIVLATDVSEQSKKVYAFHRNMKNGGQIYHFGFIPLPDEEGLQYFKQVIEQLKISPRKIIHSEGLTVTRLRTEDKEEFVTVTNLTHNKFENIEIIFNDIWLNTQNVNGFVIKDVTILERSSSLWSFNKTINKDICLCVCTSELNEVRKIVNNENTEYSITGSHFRGSRNVLELILTKKPVKALLGKKDITKRLLKSDSKLRVQFSQIGNEKEGSFKIRAVYSDDLHLTLHFNGKEKNEIVDFNIIKKNTFL